MECCALEVKERECLMFEQHHRVTAAEDTMYMERKDKGARLGCHSQTVTPVTESNS